MILDYRLKVFTLAAHLGSFSRTAATLNISQPAVSQNIAELEADIGAELFTREKGKSISLTEKGRFLLGYADRIISLYDRLNAELVPGSGAAYGEVQLRIAASKLAKEFVLPQAIKSFTAAYPNVRITVMERSDEEAGDLLRDGAIDLAVTGRQIGAESTPVAELSAPGSPRPIATAWATFEVNSSKKTILRRFLLSVLTI